MFNRAGNCVPCQAIKRVSVLGCICFGLSGCVTGGQMGDVSLNERRMLIAHLAQEGGDAAGLQQIRTAFARHNPGYDLTFFPNTNRIKADRSAHRIVFVQEESAGQRTFGATVGAAGLNETGGGDIILLRPGESVAVDEPLDFLVFSVPEPLPEELPTFIRPDWDEDITDTPGGCATEEGAYRRILLTWLESNGSYIYHALNAHRVRIMDSFSHYHPIQGGFDEFYLVQMVMPGGRIIISHHTDRIVRPESVSREEVDRLLEAHELEVGDLVYLPRGVMHRGLGGVLAQVITTPGFKPGAEIGVDHHLRAIDDRLGLEGDEALPYHEEGSLAPVIK